ncbi:DUF5518 domain-containing protein [Natrialba asiatica]|uniref:Uncharacterized protein n=1 Tax=Natrialba asiatica (strain ATCC 700177 / DSM 12278 / JCM 9576 / FERM P-10747 / NBRC 102637 / 172P1) TaxID=29540 RepID=M0AVW9_NATA1|nr:DUF5518 domain-containing protein [Natrialba asiatica]ELZ02467.1 hypothetical protein C481_07351 [Natrialba asiatica DSM 12278]
MSRLQNGVALLEDEPWNVALVVGLASTPFTVYLYWRSLPGFSHPVTPVFLAGMIVGGLATRSELDTRRVGARTGLVSALPVLWPVLDLFAFISGLTQPLWFSGVSSVAVVFVAAVIVGLSALIGQVGAIVGEWLLEKASGRPLPVAN